MSIYLTIDTCRRHRAPGGSRIRATHGCVFHGVARLFRSGAFYILGAALCASLIPGAALPEQAGAAPLFLSAGRMPGGDLSRILDDLSGRRADIAPMQRELVARPAVGPEYGGAGEEEKARWIERWLTERGLAYERLDFPDARVASRVRPNIVVVYPDHGPDHGPNHGQAHEPEPGPDQGAEQGTGQRPGPGAGRVRGAAKTPALWLLSHLDVAEAGPRELWQGDPFALRVDGDTMYGRGVEDNNQAIAVSLLLLDSLRRTKVEQPLRLGLVFTSGALTGYDCGIGYVVDKRPDLFGPEDLIVVMDYGNAEGSLVGVGEKGNLWLKITVAGKSGHAGRPDAANNAFAAGAALAHGLARTLNGQGTDFPIENALFAPPGVTVTPTRVEDYSTGVNHIPEKFIFYADARVTPDYSFADAEKAVRGLADAVERENGVSIGIERVEETPPARVTPEDAPVLAALGRAIRAELGVEPRHTGTGSVTMASVLRNKGLNVAVWGVQETMHNRPGEHARISAHIKQTRVLARMLFDMPSKAGEVKGSAGASGNAGPGQVDGPADGARK